MNIYKKILNKLFLIVSGIYVFVVPINALLANIVIVAWFILGIFQIKNIYNNIRNMNKLQISFFAFTTVFILINIISIILSTDKSEANQLMEKFLYYFFIMLIILANNHLLKNNYKNILAVFTAGTILSVILSLLRACLLFVFYSENHFFYDKLTLFYHPSYYAIFILLALSFLLLIDKIEEDITIKYLKLFYNKYLRYISIVLLILAIILLNSKANFIGLITLMGIFFMMQKTRYKILIISIILTFTLIFIVYNPRFNYYLQSIKNIKEDSRILIWKSAIKVASQKIFLGYGAADVKNKLIAQYEADNLLTLKNKNYNAHNYFLEIILANGLLGLTIFMIMNILAIYYSLKYKNYILLFFIISCFINFLVESMLLRMAGMFYWSFFISMFMGNRQKDNNLSMPSLSCN